MKNYTLVYSFLVLMVLLSSIGVLQVSGIKQEPEAPSKQLRESSPVSISHDLSVALSTPNKYVISFKDADMEEVPATEVREIPHLVLKRNGTLTPDNERTIEFVVNNVPVYAPGVSVELKITTHHSDPDLGGIEGNGIQIWSEKQFVPHTYSTQQGVRMNFSATFGLFTELENKSISTPTDYFKYQISVIDSDGNTRQSYSEDFAFLMENDWQISLPWLLESEPGAAPNQLLIYYYDMIPFQADLKDPITKIPREAVDSYIQTELIPEMVDAIETQSNDWGFIWFPEWRNFRRDEDPKTLSVALSEYGTWFHGEAPSLGHSMISIRVDGSVGEYDNLTDGLMSIFHHELFHNQQRNIALHFSGMANISGQEEAWKMFSEGTAVLASSVGQPKIQFEQVSTLRSYLTRADSYIGSDGLFGGGLNKSYRDIPYHTVTYWRFLYEKCGGMTSRGEYPDAGMKVIRSVLETLYNGDLVDINASTDSVEALPLIMDKVLASTSYCPFQNYEESLLQFAKAIYMLRLEDGRCLKPNEFLDCGFYDPNRLYTSPSAVNETFDEKPITYISGDIRSSFGIDIVEIGMGHNTNEKLATITFNRASNSNAEFIVEAIMIKSDGHVGPLEILDVNDGRATFNLGAIKTDEFETIGLVIVRTDTMEKLHDLGGYTIQAEMR